jgi:hypothetical protein
MTTRSYRGNPNVAFVTLTAGRRDLLHLPEDPRPTGEVAATLCGRTGWVVSVRMFEREAPRRICRPCERNATFGYAAAWEDRREAPR